MENMINVCLENKITTFDHADIYGDYTTEIDFGKRSFQQNCREKITIDIKMWDPNGYREP
jgi:predicted oxidoreductase